MSQRWIVLTVCWFALSCVSHPLPAQEAKRADPATDFDAAIDSLVLARNYSKNDAEGNRFFKLVTVGDTQHVEADYGTAIKNYRSVETKDPNARTHPVLFDDAIAKSLRLFNQDRSDRHAALLRDAAYELCEAESLVANDVLIYVFSTRFPNAKRQSHLPDDLEKIKIKDSDEFRQKALEYVEQHFQFANDALEPMWRHPSLMRQGQGPLDLVEYDTFSDGKGVGDRPDPSGYYHFGAREKRPSELRLAMHTVERMTRSQLAIAKRTFVEAAYGKEANRLVAEEKFRAKRVLAQEKFRECAHESYLWLATTAAMHSDSATHKRNGVGSLRANLEEAQGGFADIREGRNPRRLPDASVPNHDITTLWNLAKIAVEKAKDSGTIAEAKLMEYESTVQELKDELDRQRGVFEAPLEQLTGLDFDQPTKVKLPDGRFEPFRIVVNPRQGVDEATAMRERKRLLSVLRNRANNWLLSFYQEQVQIRLPQERIDLASMPDTTSDGAWPTISDGPVQSGGMIGSQLLEIRAATLSTLERIENFKNFPRRIDIEKQRAKSLAEVTLRTNKEIGAKQIAMGFANSVSFTLSSWPPKLSVNLSPGSIISGFLQRDITELQAELQVAGIDIESSATIQNLLLEQHRAFYDVEIARTRMVAAHAALEDSLFRLERLIDDWATAKTEASEVYLKFPLTRLERDANQRDADAAFDAAVERCYDLALALEYDWAEPFSNPIRAQPEDKALTSSGADSFQKRDSLFGVRRVADLDNFLMALEDWQNKLRENRGASYPLPHITNVMSLRKLVLGLGGEMTNRANSDAPDSQLDDRRFKQWLSERLVRDRDGKPTALVVEFATDNQLQPIKDEARGLLFPTNEWNQKVINIGVSLYGSGIGASRRVELVAGGFSKVRTFFWQQEAANNAGVLTFDLRPMAPEASLVRGAFRDRSPIKLTTYQTYSQKIIVQPNAEPLYYRQLASPSEKFPQPSRKIGVMASRWLLVIDLISGDNQGLDPLNITDIGIAFRYEYNQPPPK